MLNWMIETRFCMIFTTIFTSREVGTGTYLQEVNSTSLNFTIPIQFHSFLHSNSVMVKYQNPLDLKIEKQSKLKFNSIHFNFSPFLRLCEYRDRKQTKDKHA